MSNEKPSVYIQMQRQAAESDKQFANWNRDVLGLKIAALKTRLDTTTRARVSEQSVDISTQ